MNSLSNQFFVGYVIQTTLVNGYHIPYYVEFSEPDLSNIWLHPKHGDRQKYDIKVLELKKSSTIVTGVQGRLF